ncbi:MAG: hypothetical protein ACI9LY_003417 [Arenicella sp.]|jgi:hypothetical protein
MNTISKKLAFLPLGALLLGLALTTVSLQASAQQYEKIARLGSSEAMCSGGVETAQQLQEYFANNPNQIRSVLANSGWAGNADDLLLAVANGEMIERSYPVGTQMAWMGANVKGEHIAKPYREWAGAKSFEAFQVNVASGCQVYHIAIPKLCCNVSLIAVEPDDSAHCNTSVAVAPVAEPIIAPVKKAVSIIPFFGVFAGSETRPRYETAWDMDMVDSSGIAGIRAGLMKVLSDKNSIFGQLSYYDRNGINGGNIYPEDNFAVDIGFNRKLSERAFIGGGIGVWNVDDRGYSDTSLFGHVGGDIGKSNFQWFLEGRIFDSNSENHDSISDNKMFSGGVRYLIK